jgi:NAD(P)-dependent dehydrogenase (short-subunit alcohol dehydrogenase family)
MGLSGRVALVTGSTGDGMGRSIALSLAHDGADVVLNYGTNRRGNQAESAARQVAEAVRAVGVRAIAVMADTRDEVQVSEMLERTMVELGAIDILVNNAGGAWEPKDYTTIPADYWRHVLEAEVDGAFLLMKHVVPGMRQRHWGRIVNIGLQNALNLSGLGSMPLDYALGKAARSWMTAVLSPEEFPHGVTVNGIEPGPTEHLSLEQAARFAGGDSAEWAGRSQANAQDVAEAVRFFCSEAGRFVSGSRIVLPTG